jgi:hypothetical protein
VHVYTEGYAAKRGRSERVDSKIDATCGARFAPNVLHVSTVSCASTDTAFAPVDGPAPAVSHPLPFGTLIRHRRLQGAPPHGKHPLALPPAQQPHSTLVLSSIKCDAFVARVPNFRW